MSSDAPAVPGFLRAHPALPVHVVGAGLTAPAVLVAVGVRLLAAPLPFLLPSVAGVASLGFAVGAAGAVWGAATVRDCGRLARGEAPTPLRSVVAVVVRHGDALLVHALVTATAGFVVGLLGLLLGRPSRSNEAAEGGFGRPRDREASALPALVLDDAPVRDPPLPRDGGRAWGFALVAVPAVALLSVPLVELVAPAAARPAFALSPGVPLYAVGVYAAATTAGVVAAAWYLDATDG